MNDDEFRHKIFEFVVEEVNVNDPIELDGNPIEIVNINDDTSNFPRETDSLVELKDELSQKIEEKSQDLKEIEKVQLSSPEEIAETEKIIREDRKNELRKLAYNHELKQETYYLINRQFEK
jgi:hypothetical protein